MNTRAIATSTFWQLGSQVVMALLSIVTVKCVAVGLSRELAGQYNSAYGFLQLFGILADFGLYAVAVREVSRAEKKEDVLGALLVLRCAAVFLSLGIALVIAWTIPQWRGTPLPMSVTIAVLVPFFTLLAGILRTVYQVTYTMHFVFIAEVSQRILALLIIGFFIVSGVRGSTDLHVEHIFLFAGGLGAFLLFLLSFSFSHYVFALQPRWNRTVMFGILAKAAPYGAAFLCMAFYRQFDVTLIALLRTDFAVQNAAYGFALRASEMAFLIPTLLLNSVLPLLTRKLAEGKNTNVLLGKTFFLLLLMGLSACLFSLLWARPLMQLFTTERFLSGVGQHGADTALMLLGIPMFWNGIVLFGFYTMLARGKWRGLLIPLLFAAVLSLLLNLLLIPRYGFVGGAVTSIVVHCVLGALILTQTLRSLHMHFPPSYLLRLAGYGILLSAGLLLVRPLLTSDARTVLGLLVVSLCLLPVAVSTGILAIITPGNTGATGVAQKPEI